MSENERPIPEGAEKFSAADQRSASADKTKPGPSAFRRFITGLGISAAFFGGSPSAEAATTHDAHPQPQRPRTGIARRAEQLSEPVPIPKGWRATPSAKPWDGNAPVPLPPGGFPAELHHDDDSSQPIPLPTELRRDGLPSQHGDDLSEPAPIPKEWKNHPNYKQQSGDDPSKPVPLPK